MDKLKTTMEEIQVNNENNAILYRSPDADLFSVDEKFQVQNSTIAGVMKSRMGNGDLGGKKTASRGLASLEGTNSLKGAAAGKGLAASKAFSTEASEGKEGEGSKANDTSNSATSDNPWVNYMGQTAKSALIDRLRKNPSLVDSLRERLSELQSNGDQSGLVELLGEALAQAESEAQTPRLDNLLPMSIAEAFSMDAAETDAQIRSLLADLDAPSDPQFLPQESLFQRVNIAHRRSVLRGSLKRQ